MHLLFAEEEIHTDVFLRFLNLPPQTVNRLVENLEHIDGAIDIQAFAAHCNHNSSNIYPCFVLQILALKNRSMELHILELN